MPSIVLTLKNLQNIAVNSKTRLLGDDNFANRMPINHCWFCSLRIAASVISVYIMVAYIIAFLMELWWFWDARGQLPYLAYFLIAEYFVTFVISAVLVAGISGKRMPHLLLWMLGIVALLIPESGMVLYMSFHFWKIFTIYGLTEITCWACRLIVNVAGLFCVYSLYFNWKEEEQVLTSLRDLNMATPVISVGNGRRMSVISMKSAVLPTNVAYTNQGFIPQPELPIQQPPTPQIMRRSMSVVSLPPLLHPPPQVPPPPTFGNEFNASLFDRKLRTSIRSRSLLDLSELGKQRALITPEQTATPVPQPRQQIPQPQPRPHYTRSLDRTLSKRRRSIGFYPTVGTDRMSCGYFAVPMAGFLVDQHGNVAYVHDPVGSKTSLGSDDMHKYRDVAL
ncbi:hypothetical protein O3M35_007909 [Rhynocoris fuscipes]|uniref:Uncharacterized protein n=1 Tax=Rhynocoris fuscipes TaxID=488301 RepID=A0AAW1DCG3_9HEMI